MRNSHPPANGSYLDTRAGSPFPATRWSVVLMAREEDREVSRRAMEELCGQYWFPIYAWLRRRGYSPHNAEDLAQGFFAKVVAEETFQFAREEKGRLRTFLLTALQRHVADQARHNGARKRGGGSVTVPLDGDQAARRYQAELTTEEDPERIYLRTWARTVMDATAGRLRESYRQSGRERVYEQLSEFLGWNEGDTPYREVAARLDMSEPNVRVQVFRMRNRYRKLLEEEIAQTVSSPEELQEELEFLQAAVQG